MASLVPDVESININMVYSQEEILQSLPRTFNFFPTCSVLFRVDGSSLIESVAGTFGKVFIVLHQPTTK